MNTATAVIGLGAIGAIAWALWPSEARAESAEERRRTFQDSINIAIEAVDNDDLETYRAALATAGAQLNVSDGPTLSDEEALGVYQGMLSMPGNYTLSQILSFAGVLQAQGFDFEAGNLVMLAMGLV